MTKDSAEAPSASSTLRAVDLAILIARTRLHFQEAYRYPKLYDEDSPIIDRVGLQGDAMTVSVCTENPVIDKDIQLFRDALAVDDELLSEHLEYHDKYYIYDPGVLENGYKYFSVEKIEELRMINYLRHTGLSMCREKRVG